MAWTEEPTILADGDAAVGIVSAGIGCAVRYDRQWSWLCWPNPDGIVVARASGGPARPHALAEQRGLPFELAEQPAIARVAALTTPSWWQLHPPVAMPVRIAHAEPDRSVLVTPGPPTLILADPTATADDRTLAAIRGGGRPELLVLNASRPGQDVELAFVLDGHSTLAAYRELSVPPTVRLLDCVPFGWSAQRTCWHPDGSPRRSYTSDSEEHRSARTIASRLIEQNERLRAFTPEQLVPDPDGRDLSCCVAEWSECLTDDQLVFETADLDAALRNQPRTARQARALYASMYDQELSRPGHLVDIADGAGVVRVFGSRDYPEASVLWFRGKPAYAEALVARGTYLHLIARLAPEQRPTGFDELTAWLADPVIVRDYSDRPMVTRELLDRIDPLLRLFAPGQYEIRLEENPGRLDLRIFLNEHLHPWPWPPGTGDLQFGAGGDFVPTDTWPPPDRERIEWYRTRIEAGAQPLAVFVAPGPARPRASGATARYLLDGHHKVAAGTRMYLEITPCHDDMVSDEEFAATMEPYLDTPPFWEDSPTWPRAAPSLVGWHSICSGGAGSVTAAEYYARFGVEYGNPATPHGHQVIADEVLCRLADRLGDIALAGLREIIDEPAAFDSLLLDSLRGAALTAGEFAAVADLIDDLDEPRLRALAPDGSRATKH